MIILCTITKYTITLTKYSIFELLEVFYISVQQLFFDFYAQKPKCII